MTQNTLGLIIGGIIPALMFGLSGVFVKSSNQIGIGLGPYIITMGLTIAFVGLVLSFIVKDNLYSLQSVGHTFLSGFTWALGASLVAIAVTTYSAPISKLVPLYNMNTLVAVAISLWVFSEWKQANVMQLLIGAVLIVGGGILVARA